MKNIHILPTEKPSRLHLWTDENGTRPALCELEYSHTRNTQHIYIINDEEIKEGDWQLSNDKHITIRTDSFHESDKKIILTTDKDLIKDGVQAIDDEFLEWFVKNPSCEEVEVDILWNDDENFTHDSYKIIIPKEEPTAYHYLSCCRSVEECHCGKYPKQELERGITITHVGKQGTLEEAGAIAAGLCEHLEAKEQAMFIAGFQECLKWQAEKMYSEKEVEMIARDAYEIGRKNILIGVLNK